MNARRAAIEILVTSAIWLVIFLGLGVFLAFAFMSHASGAFIEIGLLFGAFGAVGEIGYVAATCIWSRPRWPRWLLVGTWALVAPSLTYVAMELVRQHIHIFEGLVLVVGFCVLPVFATAYIASWPFKARNKESHAS